MNKFQIMIETDTNAVIFNTAESPDEVDVFVDEFSRNKTFNSIKVFRFNDQCANYRLVHMESRECSRRPVGFGRW